MEEIINSVMQSPENTNPNVLRSQLKAIQGEGGGSDSGGSDIIFKFSGVENTPVPIPDGLIFNDSLIGCVKISGTATDMIGEPITVEEQVIPYHTINENNVYFVSIGGSDSASSATFTISNGMISISSGDSDYKPNGNDNYRNMETIEWTIFVVDISNV